MALLPYKHPVHCFGIGHVLTHWCGCVHVCACVRFHCCVLLASPPLVQMMVHEHELLLLHYLALLQPPAIPAPVDPSSYIAQQVRAASEAVRATAASLCNVLVAATPDISESGGSEGSGPSPCAHLKIGTLGADGRSLHVQQWVPGAGSGSVALRDVLVVAYDTPVNPGGPPQLPPWLANALLRDSTAHNTWCRPRSSDIITTALPAQQEFLTTLLNVSSGGQAWQDSDQVRVWLPPMVHVGVAGDQQGSASWDVSTQGANGDESDSAPRRDLHTIHVQPPKEKTGRSRRAEGGPRHGQHRRLMSDETLMADSGEDEGVHSGDYDAVGLDDDYVATDEYYTITDDDYFVEDPYNGDDSSAGGEARDLSQPWGRSMVISGSDLQEALKPLAVLNGSGGQEANPQGVVS